MKQSIILLIFLLSVSCVDQLTSTGSDGNSDSTDTNGNSNNPICDENSAPGQDLGFGGIDSVTNITQTQAKINWTKVSNKAASYTIFELIGEKLKFHKVAAGSRNNVVVKGLTPDKEYKFIIRMMDKNGVLDNNNKTISASTLAWPVYSNQRAVSLNGSRAVRLVESRNLIPNERRFTISAWFKTSTTQNDKRLVNLHRGAGASSAINLGMSNSGVFAGYRDANGSYHTINHAVNYADGSWHHLAVTYSENGNSHIYRLYFDGERVETKDDSFAGMGTFKAHIGSYNGSSNYFTGVVDEVSIWRAPLNQNQIRRIYKDENDVVGSQDVRRHNRASALVSWWRLGDGADSEASFEDRIGDNDGSGVGLQASDIVNDGP